MPIGYYDPETLTIGERVASIEFINATNSADRRRVEVRTRQDADVLLHNLRHQRDNKISALGGKAMMCRGPIQMSPGVADEGVMMIDGDEAKLLPVKIDAPLGGVRIPGRALIGAIGYLSGGALIAERAAIAPLSPMAQPSNAPRQMS